MDEGDIRCPGCDGKGKVTAFVDYADRRKSGVAEIPCIVCGGSGSIDAQKALWMAHGKAHREWRAARGETIRDCATRLRVSVTLLSAMENGRADPRLVIDDTPEEFRHA